MVRACEAACAKVMRKGGDLKKEIRSQVIKTIFKAAFGEVREGQSGWQRQAAPPQ